MGCGNSKTTATESTPSVRPPQQVDTPVEDIRGQNLQGSDPAIAPEPNNHIGNTHKSESADEPSSVGIEQTAVEKFSNSEDNHSDKFPRDDDKNENPNEQVEGNNSGAQAEGVGNVRPTSAISVDSVAVRALINHTINKAAANVCALQGKPVHRDVRPSSVASSVDSVAVRALVDATITKAAAGLKENSANSASLTENTKDQTEVEKEKNHEDEIHSAPTDVQAEDTSNPTIVVSTVPTLNFDDSLEDPKPQLENDPSEITEDQAPEPSKDTIITSSEAVDDKTESQVPDGLDSKQEQAGSLDSSTQNENINGNSNTEAEDQLNPQPEEASITRDETDGADPGDDAPEAANGQIEGTVPVVVSSDAQDAVPEPVSNTSENTVPKSSKELDPKAQESFNRAIRAFCPLVDPKLVLDLVASGIRSLHLDHAPLQADSSFTELLTKLTEVEELDLDKNEMGPQAFRVIMMALSANTSIKSAVLSNNKTDTDTAESVGVMLMTNQTLKSLDLSSNQLGKDYLSRCIGPSLKTNTSLTSLNISSCGGTDLNALMEGLLENTTLSSLNISHNQLSDSTSLVTSLSAVLKNSSCAIKELNVRNCGIQGPGLQLLGEGVKENSSLITLHAGGNDVSNVNVFVEFLVTCLQHATVETLNLNDTRISETGNQNLDLAPINEKRKSCLKNLNLANCSITDEIMKVLANHLPACLPHITELSLSGNSEMTTASLQSVAQLTALTEGSDAVVSSGVTHLHLDQQSLEGLPDHLLNNPSFPSLTMLSLCKARISPTSLGRLSELLQGPGGLTELCLSGLKLSETQALAQLLEPAANLSLKSLSLAGCALKDSDLEPLTSALAAGWCLTSLTLANNRLTGSGINPLLEAMISSGEPLLESFNLNSNQLSDDCQDVLTSLLTKAKKLHTMSFNRNSLGCETLSALIQLLHLAESLKLLDLRNQESPLDEEDMEELMKKLAGELGYTLHEDKYGGIEAGRGSLPSRSSDLSILLTGLGVDLGPVGRSLDSAMVKTDHGVKHPLPLSLQHALHLGAWMTAQDPTSQPELSAASWEAIIGIRKDSTVPSWLKVESLRGCAVYISNLSSNVSASKLEGDLDAEADCNVKEVCIMKDLIQRKPNGYAWVLMADQESVKRAMDFYYSGQALMFSQPYIISPVSLKLPDLTTDDTTEDQVSEEMARRERERVAEAAKHQQLLETSFAASRARHEYAKAHPAYADGRIF
eukprot:XP_800128.3 PREDICTED: uncharacterized protein LOC581313 [Strongylocentrotus purpuratus]